MSFNKIILVGNLGKDPELRYTPQGNAVCSFTMATNERKRNAAGEQEDVTTWFRVTLWGKQAENASKYLQKGRPVYIEGRLRLEEYTDRDGKTRQSLEVNGSDMQFIGGRNEEEAGGGSYRQTSEPRADYDRSSGGGSEPRREYDRPEARGDVARGNFGGGKPEARQPAKAAKVQPEADDFDGDNMDEDIPF